MSVRFIAESWSIRSPSRWGQRDILCGGPNSEFGTVLRSGDFPEKGKFQSDSMISSSLSYEKMWHWSGQEGISPVFLISNHSFSFLADLCCIFDNPSASLLACCQERVFFCFFMPAFGLGFFKDWQFPATRLGSPSEITDPWLLFPIKNLGHQNFVSSIFAASNFKPSHRLFFTRDLSRKKRPLQCVDVFLEIICSGWSKADILEIKARLFAK